MRLRKCLILLENFYPRFPTFPHTRWKFRELEVKVKYKNHRKQRDFEMEGKMAENAGTFELGKNPHPCTHERDEG